MTLPYALKLLCLCFAAFFLIHLALAVLVKLATPAVLRVAAGRRPAWAAGWLFFWRMLPAGFGVGAVAGFCIPSYLRLEPKAATSEEVGLLCLVFSFLGVFLWAASIARGWAAIAGSQRYLQLCRRNGRKTALPGESMPVWMVEEPAAQFAIAGIARPTLLISRQVRDALSGEQLAAALRHERAHWSSRDNLKRLLLLLAPDTLPFLHGFRTLEQDWSRQIERAADDRAVDGDAGRSLALATALVRVSRLGVVSRTSALVAPLLAADDDLPVRVERLLAAQPPAETAPVAWGCLVAGAAAMLSASIISLQPALLQPVHRLLEHLIR